jgi:hypothetical protein
MKQVDTLIKYLVDSLQSYESGHGNALHPVALETEQVFMGEHVVSKPATCGDVHQVQASIDRRLTTFISDFTSLNLARETYHSAPISFQPPPSSTYPQLEWQVLTTPTVLEASSPSPQPLPTHGVFISDLGRQPGAWRRAVKQWEEVDPTTGWALKDWPVKWYTGDMRIVTGSKRSQRKIIFDEYERYAHTWFYSSYLVDS